MKKSEEKTGASNAEREVPSVALMGVPLPPRFPFGRKPTDKKKPTKRRK